DLEDERAILDKQLYDLNSKYEQVIAENEKLKNISTTTTSTTSETPEDKFRVIYARYGAEESYRDVTEIVAKEIITSGRITVDNKTFEGDPLAYSVKNLFMIYEFGNVTHSLTANESEFIELKAGKLIPIPTESSQRKQLYLKNQEKIGNIFSGLWVLNFTTKEGVQNSESVINDNKGRYFAHSKHKFYLKSITIDDSSKKITFNKVDLQRKLYNKETLTIQNSDLITGIDSKGQRLEYKRQK